jgi:uncharacterized protein YjbI with pentapeptide repeats
VREGQTAVREGQTAMRAARKVLVASLVGTILLSACTSTTSEPEASTTPGLPCLADPTAKCRALDFEGLDMTGMDLAGRDLAYSDLDGANLTGANLSGANFFGASLQGVVLRGANMRKADLYAADVRDADMVGADLSGSNLTETNFYGADLSGADLDGTLLVRTSFGNANLTDASVRDAIVTRTDLRGTDLSQSVWTNSVTRGEYAHADDLEELGALVCDFTGCSKEIIATSGGGESVIDPDMFRVAMMAQMRMAPAYLADPPSLSRLTATSMLGASGVYGLDLDVAGWNSPAVILPAELQDAAALYALNNVALGIRFDTVDRTRNTILQPVEGPRDTVLWRATENNPASRAAIVYAATLASAAALERAANDGHSERRVSYDVQSGAWQPTAPGFAPSLQPGWGELQTFRDSSRQCRAGAPVLDDAGVQEVIEITNNLTSEQKSAARFWDDERIRTNTPIGHWHDITLQIVESELREGRLIPREAVQLMAEMHMAMADAMIMTWFDKYAYRTARPITVIRGTDEYWNSYLGNPPFPAYPSGHAAVSAAAAEVITDHLGEFEFTDNRFRANSGAVETLNSAPRTYPNVRAAAKEAALSRVWGGIHFMTDADGGERVGKCTAEAQLTR